MDIARHIRCTLAAAALAMLAGCANQGYSVIASTATTIGVGIGQQPSNGSLDAILGYKRAEFALVPTNRNGSTTATVTGAKDAADVIMELRYSGIFSTGGDSGIYQRLAIGTEAVKQQGAAAMFAKGHDGKLGANAAAAVNAVASLPSLTSDQLTAVAQMAQKYSQAKSAKNATELTKHETAAKAAGYSSFEDFLRRPKAADVPRMREALKDNT